MKFVAAAILVIALTAMNVNAAENVEHVVSLKFKPTASAADIKKVEDAFRALKGKIPEITSLKWGTNMSKENMDKGFTHCFILSFKNETNRDTYITHPEHNAFKTMAVPLIADVFVIDFRSKD